MATNPPDTRAAGGLQIGRVFGRGFAAVRGNPATLFGLAFVFSALPSMVFSRFNKALTASFADQGGNAATLIGGAAVFGILLMVLSVVAQGAITHVAVAQMGGERLRFGQGVRHGLRVFFPLAGLFILFGLALMLGLVLLVVPGIILYIVWSVAGPALIEERAKVITAFGRSRMLTSGARWPIFGFELIVLVCYSAVSGTVGGMLFAVYGLAGTAEMNQTGQTPLWYQLLGMVVTTAAVTLWTAMQAALYVELREWKEGPGSARLADIFA